MTEYQEQIDRITGVRDQQTSLISQIKAALDGKAAGGGGAAAEVCEVTIVVNKMTITDMSAYYMTIDDSGEIVNGSITFMTGTVKVNILKNSIMFLDAGSTVYISAVSGGLAMLNGTTGLRYYAIHVTDEGSFTTGD